MPKRAGPSDRYLTTILMTDIVGSTEHVAELGDRGWRELVQLHHRIVRDALRRFDGREIDTAGDGFFAVFDAPAAAVQCASEVGARITELGIQIRAGVHVGEVEEMAGKVGGLAVPIAARITGIAGPGEVLVSSTVRDLAAGAGLRFDDRGVHRLKGVPGEWRVFAVSSPAGSSRPGSAPSVAISEPELAHRRATAVRRARSRPVWERRPWLAASIVVLVAATLGASGLLVWKPWQTPALAGLAEDSVGVIDVTRREIVGSVEVGSQPGAIAIHDEFAWVVNQGADTVARIDVDTHTVTREIDVGRGPTAIVVAGGSVWVANSGDRTVTRIDADTARVVDTIDVGNGPGSLAAAEGTVWVAITGDSTVVPIDAASGSPGVPIPVAAGPVALVADERWLWIASAGVASVSRLDPRSGATPATPIALAGRPASMALAAGSLWVAGEDGAVTRIDADDGRVVDTIDLGGSLASVVADETAVWVADRGGSVARIDLANVSGPPARIATATAPEGLATRAGQVWVTARAEPSAHRGGTLRVVLLRSTSPGPVPFAGLDPVLPIPYNLAMLQADGLVGYRRVGGVAGTTLLPNLATAIPRPTDGGREYAFQLRPDLHYSDGRPVRASDFRRAMERSFQTGLGVAPGNFYFNAIIGADACATPDFRPVDRCDLSGGVAVDDEAGQVVFRLSRPDPDFLAKLAISPAYPVPDGAPMHALAEASIPGTGPYAVADISEDTIRLVRNEQFRVWNAAVRPDGFPDEIVYHFVSSITRPEDRVAMVGGGEADYTPLRGPMGLPPDLLAQVSRQYAGQVHFGPALLTMVVMDSTRPPFDTLAARQAISMAVDRASIAERYGGPPAVGITCQFMPPGWPGYRPYCPFTAQPDAGGRWHAPDHAAARDLVDASGTRGAEVRLGPARPQHTQTLDALARTLEKLGYRVTVDRETDDAYVTAALNEGRIQLSVFDLVPDIMAPSTYFREFTCSALEPIGAACDEAYDALVDEALVLQETDAAAAAVRWGEVERAAVDRALWIPLFHQGGDLTSERVGNVHFHPSLLVLLDQLWVQ